MSFIRVLSEDHKNKIRCGNKRRNLGLPHPMYEEHHHKRNGSYTSKNPCYPDCSVCKVRKHGLSGTHEYINMLQFLKFRKIDKRVISEDFFYLLIIFFHINATIKNQKRSSQMNAKTLMAEIKSNALKQIAESLNEVLDKIKSEEIDVKQGMAQIVAHKHIIQTIALDWTFNGIKNQVKSLTD